MPASAPAGARTAFARAAAKSVATRRRTEPRPVVRFRSSRPDLLICFGLLAVIMLVQGWNITGFPALSDDEGTYLSQAWAVQQGEGLAHYTYWYDHPPLGWIQIAGLTYLPSLIWPESMNVATMRPVMLLISAISAVLVYVLARRLFLPRWAAALAMAAFGLSPLSVYFQRELFLDNIAVMWMLLAFCLAASPSRHLWHQFAAGLAGAVSVLSKETMLLVLPALLVTLWTHSHRETRKFVVTGAITSCALIGLSYPLYALLNNELFASPDHVSLFAGIEYQLSRPGSGFILDAGSGSHKTFQAWLYYDPILPLAGVAAAVLLLLVFRWSVTARAIGGPALAVAILTLLAFRPDGYLPAMYVIQALPFLALVLAGAAASIVHMVLHRRRTEPAGDPAAETTETPGAPATMRDRFRKLLGPRHALVAVLAVLAAVATVPAWAEGNRDALTQDDNRHYRAAAAWFENEIDDPANTRVLVDDALWLDLVHDGYTPGTGVFWFYKADLDPAVMKTIPRGWRDIDYIVSTVTVRRDAPTLPTTAAALANSTPVVVFGTGDDRIEIRRINGGKAAPATGGSR
ncbi:phospholipid carrier-dependent glycosyltransferase [Streptomyces qinzhouensis]|uniref:Phospholipid carrier-dependent glycosyltransferase n=1 Tax=Streptomyces qinzhouensis TaxID=2599401 RepID=A0A5B8JMU6_9ACTN|nr:phospholipid carrier-dependent glycosyltransferase [Streptomyces qinzhouensis]